jgi:Tol biopolymer transport system component
MVWKASALLGLSLSVIPSFDAPVHGQPSPPPVELISVGTDGLAGNNHSGSDGLIPPRTRISADGRYIVFESYASTMVCEDNDFSTRDIFVRDRLTGRATLASMTWNGGNANHDSFDPVISGDGRYVAFESLATNLVPGDTNDFIDIFLRDLVAGTTTRISVSSAGDQSNSVSHAAAISQDGRYVAFHGGASNLAPGDTNFRWDTFVRDTVANTTERASVSTTGEESWCCDSLHPSITADGRYVAFLSQGRLDPTTNNNWQEIFLRDRVAGTTTIVRPAADGSLSSGGVRFAEISADGLFIAFQSASANIVVPDANGSHDVFLKDLVAGTTTLVSQALDGTHGNGDSWMPSISADGRFVAFHSWANNLVLDDTNTLPFFDIFVRDTLFGTTTRLNLTPSGGEADGSSTAASISADGSVVSFDSTATNLAPNERINGFPDVYLAGPSFPGGGGTSFQFESGEIEVLESAGLATVTVTRHGPFCSAASVELTVADGTATAGADYTAASRTLNFSAGEASQILEVVILQDEITEPNETLELILSNASGGPDLGTPSTAAVIILDDDTRPNQSPDAVDDAAETSEETAVAIDVRANDSDPDGDPLTITAVTHGSHGTVVDDGTGRLSYTPSANFVGTDAFQYTIEDGKGGADTAWVQVAVLPVNDLPSAAADSYGLRENMRLDIPASIGVLANDTDIDADFLIAVLVTGPAHGAVTLAPNGSFTFTPEPGFSGSDFFTYRAMDPSSSESTPTIVTMTVKPGEAPASTVRPVVPAVLHPMSSIPRRLMGEPFLGNRRLALIEDGGVPCMEVDTMEVTRCLFQVDSEFDGDRRLARSSGDWLEGADGLSYAVVGQPVTRDGTWAGGSFIVAAEPDPDGRVAGIAPSGRDAVSEAGSTDMVDTCMLEEAGTETNVSGMPLVNWVELYVGTTSLVHPDGARLVSLDEVRGIAWYTGTGAAVNDINGERGPDKSLFHTWWACHLIERLGAQVPAGKRPSTRSSPAPGVVDINSRIRWLPVNPYVDIANASPFDPRILGRPLARFVATPAPDTLRVDASSTVGDILKYEWRLDWTSAPVDAVGPSPLAEFPLIFDFHRVPPASGRVTLKVTARDGQTDTLTQRITFVRPDARFEFSLGLNTLWVDASATEGDIREYEWQLDWTPALVDAVGPSPLAEFPLAFQGVPPASGLITLKVTTRNGLTDTATQRVNFRRLFPPLP